MHSPTGGHLPGACVMAGRPVSGSGKMHKHMRGEQIGVATRIGLAQREEGHPSPFRPRREMCYGDILMGAPRL